MLSYCFGQLRTAQQGEGTGRGIERTLAVANFLNPDETWRPLAERGALLEEALGSDRDVAWCVMCGSGGTACHLAISGLEAGFSEPQLYVGSWSERLRAPDRPIAGSKQG